MITTCSKYKKSFMRCFTLFSYSVSYKHCVCVTLSAHSNLNQAHLKLSRHMWHVAAMLDNTDEEEKEVTGAWQTWVQI